MSYLQFLNQSQPATKKLYTEGPQTGSDLWTEPSYHWRAHSKLNKTIRHTPWGTAKRKTRQNPSQDRQNITINALKM